jgi:hypothetical protein
MASLDALLTFVDPAGLPPDRESRVASAGRGPYSRTEFRAGLREYAGRRVFTLAGIGAGNTVVVGNRLAESEWAALWDLVKERTGQQLFVFSQEMYLAYLVSGRNPFDEGVADMFVEGHAALTTISEKWVDWDTGVVGVPSKKPGVLGPFAGESVLSLNGYWSTLPTAERRSALRTIYEAQAKDLEWPSRQARQFGGDGHSGTRLEIMLHLIRFQVEMNLRRAKKHGRPTPECVTVWTSDLEWMFKEFYKKGRHNFEWKTAQIRPL